MQLPLYLTNTECRRWLLWRSIPREGGKPRKIPYYANGAPRKGRLDSEIDLKQLLSHQEAKTVFDQGGYDGLGFALGPDGNGGYWQGIDLDDIDQNSNLASLVLPGYVEVSPSGKGRHAIGYGRKFNALGSNKTGVEAYSEKRFFTFTGQVISTTDVLVDLFDFVEFTLCPLHASSFDIIKANNVQSLSPISLENMQRAVINSLRLALEFIPSDDYDEWISVGQALYELGEEGFKLWRDWSAKSPKFLGDKDSARWKTFKGDRTHYSVILNKAYRNGWRSQSQIAPESVQNIMQKMNVLGWREIDISNVLTSPPKPTQFLIETLVPVGHLTLLAAHGGAGKSIFALQAAICLSLGLPFMGKVTHQCRLLFYSAEDSEDIVQKRCARIFQSMNLNLSQLAQLRENLKIIDTTGNPVLFAEFYDKGVKQGLPTHQYYELQKLVKDFSVDLLIVDNASDTFDANENDRSRVRGFLRLLLKMKPLMAILLLAHIDKQTAKGHGDTEGYSGSTAWHNSARSRIFLAKENNILVAKHQKSNHGTLAEDIMMTWTADGILCNVILPNKETTVDIIISLLKKYHERGNYISTAHTSPMNASKILRADSEFPISVRTNKELWSILLEAENKGLLIRINIPGGGRGKHRQVYVPTAPACSNMVDSVSTDTSPSSALSTTGGVGEVSADTNLHRESLYG